MKKNKRKYARYPANIPIRFIDTMEVTGDIVDVSNSGCMIVLHTQRQLALGSQAKFQAFLDGVIPRERTKPEASLQKLQSQAKVQYEVKRSSDHEVHITGTVMRYSIYKGKEALGIKFTHLNETDLKRWIIFVDRVREAQEVFNYGMFEGTMPEHSTEERRKYKRFTIKFPSVQTLKNFFPTDSDNPFFVPTKTEIPKGKKIAITLIHPEKGTQIVIIGIVKSFEQHPMLKAQGLFCHFEEKHSDLKFLVNNFLSEEFYI